MNWSKARNYTLLGVLCALIFSTSCINQPETVASTLQLKNEVISTYFQDTFSIKTTLYKYDTVRTDNSERLLFGNFVDPELGRTSVVSFAEFQPNAQFGTFGPNPKLDSTLILIQFQQSTTLGSNTVFTNGYRGPVQTLNIYRLLENIDNTQKIYQDRVFAKGDLISTAYFSTGADFQAPLDSSIGHELLFNPQIFESVSAFRDRFKGVMLEGGASNTAVWGVIRISIKLKYHNYYALSNLKVNDSLIIPMTPNTAAAVRGKSFSVSTDRSGTIISSLVNNYDSINTTSISDQCFLQSNAGIGTVIRFPALENFKKAVNGEILVNRAEIIIKPEITDSVNFPPSPNLILYELNHDGRIRRNASGVEVLLQNEVDGNYLGSGFPVYIPYNASERAYKIPFSVYLQSILDGKKGNYGFLIMGSDQTYIKEDIRYSLAVVNKTKFYNNSTSNFNIKLRVHYTPYQ